MNTTMPISWKLSDGHTMPGIGFGTWQLTRSVAKDAVACAIECGYRLIDTATLYANEQDVGKAIHDSSVNRQELFITTKVWNSDQGYDLTIKACETSLEHLGLEYIDLYLIHWPATSHRTESWRALIELQRQGKVKSIGVSNYSVGHLQELMAVSDALPAVNQIEFHPFIYDQQKDLVEFCQRYGIVVEAYSPLSRQVRMNHSVIQSMPLKPTN